MSNLDLIESSIQFSHLNNFDNRTLRQLQYGMSIPMTKWKGFIKNACDQLQTLCD